MQAVIQPPHLQAGDRVALIAPAFQAKVEQIQQMVSHLNNLQLQVDDMVTGQETDGYFAIPASKMVAQLHDAFLNPNIKAIIAVRGGYGCARLLPDLDWSLITQHPKIVLGFSDITALLIAIYQRSGLMTFHGTLNESEITTKSLQDILFSHKEISLTYDDHSTVTVVQPGAATGQLIGGNLSVLTSLIGSPYLPTDWRDKILFLEDVNEEVYRIDRMLTQLQLANILPQIKGLIFGSFHQSTTKVHDSFTLIDVLTRTTKHLNIPIIKGALFGHQSDMLTFPIGATAHLDAHQSNIKLMQKVREPLT